MTYIGDIYLLIVELFLQFVAAFILNLSNNCLIDTVVVFPTSEGCRTCAVVLVCTELPHTQATDH